MPQETQSPIDSKATLTPMGDNWIYSPRTGNPLLEQLPEQLDVAEFLHRIKRAPDFSSADRQLPLGQRCERLHGLKDIFVPRGEHVRIYLAIDSAMRAGYRRRNPLEVRGQQYLYASLPTFKSCLKGVRPAVDDGSCLAVVGVTGAGKTRFFHQLSGIYPAFVNHADTTGGHLQMIQIPLMIIRCPNESSPKAMARQFFEQLLNQIGPNAFSSRYLEGRRTMNELAIAMGQACKTFAIGVIVWDEFQDICEHQRSKDRQLANLLLYLRDLTGVPMVYVGTYPMIKMLEIDARISRRSTEGGMVRLDRLPPNALWVEYCRTYWDYQWVRKPQELTPAICEVLYTVTQGIPGFLQQIFSITQSIAMITARETIDEAAIRLGYNECTMLHGKVEALSSGCASTLALYPDLYDPKFNKRDAFEELTAVQEEARAQAA